MARQPPREIVRDRDGNLFDVGEHRPVTLAELAEDVRAGRRFRARDQDGDALCTQQVLLEVLRHSALTPALSNNALGGAGLAGIAGLLGDVIARAGRRDELLEPRRARPPRARRGPTGIPLPGPDHEEPRS
jgi:hypothetical protein